MCFQPGQTQTGLYKHRRWLEAGNFGFRKKRNCTIRVAKTKALISFAVTAKLICAFVFAYAGCWFSHAVAQFCVSLARIKTHNFNDAHFDPAMKNMVGGQKLIMLTL